MPDSFGTAPQRPPPRPSQDDLGGMFTLLGRALFAAFAITIFATVQFWNEFGQPWGPVFSTWLAFFAFALHFALVRRRVGAIDPVVWLPVCLMIFYFGAPIAMEYIFVDPPLEGYDPWQGEIGPPRAIDRGYCLALLTMVSFIWGLHLAGFRDLSRGPDPSSASDESLAPTAYVFTIGALAMVAAGIAIAGPSVIFGYYGDWWAAKAAGADARWVDFGIIFAGAGAFALLASSTPKSRMRVIFAITVVVLMTAINIQKGARAAILVTLVGAGWCYTQRVRRLTWPPVLIGALLMLIVLPALREWRAERSIEATAQASPRELIGTAIYAMGGTVSAFAYSLDFIPKEKPFVYGQSFLGAFVRAVPNLGLTPGKSWGGSGVEDHPASWITARVSPGWYRDGGGFGFAMGAEFYFNFGATGVLLGVAGLGFLTGRIRNASCVSSMKLVASALFFVGVASFVRDVFAYPLKVFLWPLTGILIVRAVVSLVYKPPAREHAMLPEGGGDSGDPKSHAARPRFR